MNLHVDLNADLGEGAGHDRELLKLVSSEASHAGFMPATPTRCTRRFPRHARKARRLGPIRVFSIARISAGNSCRSRLLKFLMRSPTSLASFRQLLTISACGRIM